MSAEPTPFADRDDLAVHGHWLLARLGKRVLRPGGLGLTRTLLAESRPTGADVVELAPGLGRTAGEIIAPIGSVVTGDAASTGLPDADADLVIGEAMLTMQGEKAKAAIVAVAVRLLRPGGRYAIHELALVPESIGDEVKTDIRHALARSIKVNARPLTLPEWEELLTGHGLVVDHVHTTAMALLDPRRIIADEGLLGTLRFGLNLLRQRDARRRVLAMRATFRAHRSHLRGIAVVAHKPQ